MNLRSKKAVGQDVVGELEGMSNDIERLSALNGYGHPAVRSLVLQYNSASAQAVEVIDGDREYAVIKKKVEQHHKKSQEYMKKLSNPTSQPASPQG